MYQKLEHLVVTCGNNLSGVFHISKTLSLRFEKYQVIIYLRKLIVN